MLVCVVVLCGLGLFCFWACGLGCECSGCKLLLCVMICSVCAFVCLCVVCLCVLVCGSCLIGNVFFCLCRCAWCFECVVLVCVVDLCVCLCVVRA